VSEPPALADALAAWLDGRRWLGLTGAGCSTESGIPDYRGPGARPRTPVTWAEFRDSAAARQRYWARSAVGWPRFRAATPNAAHRAFAALEAGGVLVGLLTQNVDGLHQKAGHTDVVELHGNLGRVRCLGCELEIPRDEVQGWLELANPGWAEQAEDAPDGDAELDRERTAGFRVPDCARCRGVLKPDVVFFGENVPAPRVEGAWALLDRAEALLVVGSSLTVWSGYRFARRAHERGLPVLLLNQGETRADPIATLKLEGRAGEVLPALVGRLVRGGAPPAGTAPPGGWATDGG